MLVSMLRTAAVAALLASVVPAASALAADSKDDPVVAKVDGKEIHRSTILEMKDQMARQLPQLQSMPMAAIFPGLQERAVNQQLLTREAKKADLEDDPEVKQQLEKIREELVQRLYLSRTVEKQVDDAKLRAAYDEFVKANPPEDEVHARHILVDSEKKAQDILKKLGGKGAPSFEELADKESTGPSKKNGGDLGFFSKRMMVPEFAEAAFALKPGEISKTPVKTQFGWHIIKVEERRKSSPPTFEEAKEELRAQVAEGIIQKLMKDLRDKAKVELFDIDGKPVTAEAAPAGAGASAPPAGAAR